MTITKNDSGENFAMEHESIAKKASVHESVDRTITGTFGARQNLFYILNTLFFTVIAFIAGYNLKSWQIQNSANQSVVAAKEYIQKADESRRLSTQLLEELKDYETKHYESSLIVKATPARIPVNTRSIPDVKSSPGITDAAHPSVKMPLVQKTKPGRIVQKAMAVQPLRYDISGVNIYHTVQKGDALSMLVDPANINDFLERNPHITNPNRIYPGQRLLIKIPDRSIQTGAYMDNYFIQPDTGRNGNLTYDLVKWINIPDSDSLIGHIIKQPKQKINRSTIPYINLADFANTMKEEIFNGDVVILSGKNKINRIKRTHTGIYFKTVRNHPLFSENQFPGIHQQKETGFYENMDSLKDFLIRYLAYVNQERRGSRFFHFMIFDRTIVQTDYLESTCFNDNGSKTEILIGLVHPTNRSKRTLIELQSSLTTGKIETGKMAEINYENINAFQNK